MKHGRAVAPDLVVSIAANGGFNHAVGFNRATRVLAINRDPDADIFDQAAARTGLRDHEAAGGFDPVTTETQADDHKAYYPGSHRITIRVTGDRTTGRLLGMQLFGHKNAEIAKRTDIAATAIYHGMTVDAVSDLDLSYTPPLGSPWDAVQMAAQAWVRDTRPR